MKKILKKQGIYLIIAIILLASSWVYRIALNVLDTGNGTVKNELADKTVITVWMREGHDSETRRYQVDRFNRENRDNIYIDFYTYKEDYFNMLRTSLAAMEKPDIFQYGYYELLKNDSIMRLDEAGIDIERVHKDNLFYFNREPFGVKVTGNNVKFVWNREMFEKAGLNPDFVPSTWDEVIAYSLKIKEAFPDVVPFEFPAFTMGGIKASIGEASVNLGSIYTTFWDYKEGVYEFGYARDILNIYNKMYSMGLLDREFYNKGRDDLRKDFHEGKAAMIVSTFEDKNYFTNIIPLDFSIGVGDLPKINAGDLQNYYYTENFNCLVINKNIEDKEAVGKVYEWFLEPGINRDLLSAGKALPLVIKETSVKDDLYDGYNEKGNFANEVYDPTVFVHYNGKETIKLFCDAIRGEKTVDEVIKQLNKNYASYSKFMVDKDSFDFSKYIDR